VWQRTDVVYCVPVSSAQSPQPKKKRRLAQYLQNIKDSYTISRRSYPWIGWAMLAASAACLALGVAIAFASGMSLWYWLFLSILLALMVDMIILSMTVRRASYAQIEGMPGATKAVLDQIGRGWDVESEPAARMAYASSWRRGAHSALPPSPPDVAHREPTGAVAAPGSSRSRALRDSL